jgi:hypothetical protein
MRYLNYFINSLLDKPNFYFVIILIVVLIQTIFSLVTIKLLESFLKKKLKRLPVISLTGLLSLIFALPSAKFLSSMMCFTLKNDELDFVNIMFILWCFVFIALPCFFMFMCREGFGLGNK